MHLGSSLAAQLVDSRELLLKLFDDLDEAQLAAPKLPIVNLPVWELGHVGWFQERWTLRHLRGMAPLRADADALFDSAAIAHDTRWELPLPARDEVKRYVAEVLERVVEGLETRVPDERDAYFHRLALFHEDMHGEAFVYTRRTLGCAPPRARELVLPHEGSLAGDVEIPGRRFRLGTDPAAEPFVFDNEMQAHEVDVATFRMARAPVTNAQFAEFVDAGGYARDELWSDAGRAWKASVDARAPLHWSRATGGGWSWRHYDRFVPLREHAPVLHVSWFEAEAYCTFASRRLPSEAEWELAASIDERGVKRRYPWGDAPPDAERACLDLMTIEPRNVAACATGDSAHGLRQLVGNVWEWTSSDFRAYPGFVAGPYAEYSEPWFSGHKVLRGGCYATRSRLIRSTWRNFYTPDRRDVLAGFRTCPR